jgi:hypothetical protein
MNLTRAYTVHNRVLCTIGRVQTPTLAMIVARDQAIDAFVPTPFYELIAQLAEGFEAKYHKPVPSRRPDQQHDQQAGRQTAERGGRRAGKQGEQQVGREPGQPASSDPSEHPTRLDNKAEAEALRDRLRERIRRSGRARRALTQSVDDGQPLSRSWPNP